MQVIQFKPKIDENIINKDIVTLSGVVSDRENDNGKYVVYLKDVIAYTNNKSNEFNETSRSEKSQIKANGVIVYLNNFIDEEKLKIGSAISVSGKVALFRNATNYGEFDQFKYQYYMGYDFTLKEAYLIKSGEYYSLNKEMLLQIREYCLGQIDEFIAMPYSGTIKALLLGEKKDLDTEIKELYQRNGIIHILSISGLHISIIGTLLYQLLKRLSKYQLLNILITIVILGEYVLMIGSPNSAVRAAIMFVILLFSTYFIRTYDMLTAMSVSYIIILFSRPLAIFQSGTLLSFAAVAGIAIIFPKVQEAFEKDITDGVRDVHWSLYLKQALLCSMSIQLATLPIIVNCYYSFPITSVLLNILLVPTVLVLVLGGIVCVLISAICIPVARLISYILIVMLEYYGVFCELMLELPFQSISIAHADTKKIIVYYLLLIMLVIISKKITKYFKIIRVILLLLAFVVLIYNPNNNLIITVIDVGQGDGILVQTPDDKAFLVDGGSTNKKEVGKYQIVPTLKYYGISELEGIFITHMDKDHVSGIIEMLENQVKGGGIRINNLFIPTSINVEKFEEIRKLAEKCGIPIHKVDVANTIECAEVKLEVIYPRDAIVFENDNENSLILRVDYGDFDALLTGDIENEGELRMMEELARHKVDYEFLKVGHHGSKNATKTELLELINPEIAAISAGIDNSYGHPHKEVIERLEEYGVEYYVTNEVGAIEVTSDGSSYWVETVIK